VAEEIEQEVQMPKLAGIKEDYEQDNDQAMEIISNLLESRQSIY